MVAAKVWPQTTGHHNDPCDVTQVFPLAETIFCRKEDKKQDLPYKGHIPIQAVKTTVDRSRTDAMLTSLEARCHTGNCTSISSTPDCMTQDPTTRSCDSQGVSKCAVVFALDF